MWQAAARGTAAVAGFADLAAEAICADTSDVDPAVEAAADVAVVARAQHVEETAVEAAAQSEGEE